MGTVNSPVVDGEAALIEQRQVPIEGRRSPIRAPPEPAAGHSYPSAMRRRRLTPSVVATIIVAIASTAASASRAPILRAFERPATKVDRVPRQLTSRMRVIDGRRVATYVAPRRRARRTTLFVATVAGKGWCLITIQFQPRSAAASCGPRLFGMGSFF